VTVVVGAEVGDALETPEQPRAYPSSLIKPIPHPHLLDHQTDWRDHAREDGQHRD